MKKKVLSLLVSLVMLIGMLPTTAMAADFHDTDGNWAEEAIDRWSDYGVIGGNNGYFNPSGALTRAHMAAVLARLLKLPEADSYGFKDVAEDSVFAPYINSCAAAGIMLGNNGYANPNSPITRQQAIVMLARALGIAPVANPDLSKYSDANQVADYAVGYMAAMNEAGIVGGTSATTLSPLNNITRAATMVILHRAIDEYVNKDSAVVDAKNVDGIIIVVAKSVQIKNAPEGTIVVIADGVGSVKINGKTVTDDQTYEVPAAPAPSGGGGGGGHSHSYTTPVNKENGTHTMKCSCGAENSAVPCTYDWDTCSVCGYQDGNYYIDTVADLERFREAVNADDDFSGKVVKLTADIDLENAAWTPIGATEADGTHHFFQGTFDGQNNTISNLNVEDVKEDAGLFGYLGTATVQNLELDTVTITGNHSAGAIAGTAGFGAVIQNCDVADVTITLTPDYDEAYDTATKYDNGDDAGAIVGNLNGYQYSATSVIGCSAENVVIHAYRDAGGIVGTANASGYTLNVTGCSVNGVEITIDQTGATSYGDKAPNAAAIVGRNISANEADNTEAGTIVIKQILADGFVLDLISGEYEVSNANGLKYFRGAVNVGNNFRGETVKLMADINLNNEEWTPIGLDVDHAFSGTFDGQNHKISNLKITSGREVGLFGLAFHVSDSVVIKNVVLENANVTGEKNVGGIAGTAGTGTTITGCSVIDSELKAVPVLIEGVFDDGDDVGVIAGHAAPNTTITNNTVDGVTITAFRDVGGVVGYACNGTTVTGNTVTDTDVIQDKVTNAYNHSALTSGKVVGNADAAAIINTNTAGDDVTVTILLADGLKLNAEGVYEVSNANGLSYANEHFFAVNNVKIKLTDDIDMSGVTGWQSEVTQTNNFSFDGANHKITGLETAGKALLVPMSNRTISITNLTLENCKVDNDEGYTGMLVGYADANTVTIENCHILGGNVAGNNYAGGLIGWSTLNFGINNCSVKNATITGGGSTGAISGHCVGDVNGVVTISNATVTGNTIECTEDRGGSSAKAGALIGTVNTGEATITIGSGTVSNNTVTNHNAAASYNEYVGRVVGGTLIMQ